MNQNEESLIEQVGEKFNLETYLKAREICKEACDEIFLNLSEGMSEKQGQELVKYIFSQKGVTKFWHPTKFRFGSDTQNSFRDLPNDKLRLQKGDYIFLDLGPIIDDHEADFGRTTIFSQINPTQDQIQHCNSSYNIFKKCEIKWKNEKLTGEDLFNYARNLAQEAGYELNPAMAGHRLGDFPHQVYSKQKLFEYKKTPINQLWVLEIHLVDKKNQRGSFFEDILME